MPYMDPMGWANIQRDGVLQRAWVSWVVQMNWVRELWTSLCGLFVFFICNPFTGKWALSNKSTIVTFHCTGWSIGILITVFYMLHNPQINQTLSSPKLKFWRNMFHLFHHPKWKNQKTITMLVVHMWLVCSFQLSMLSKSKINGCCRIDFLKEAWFHDKALNICTLSSMTLWPSLIHLHFCLDFLGPSSLFNAKKRPKKSLVCPKNPDPSRSKGGLMVLIRSLESKGKATFLQGGAAMGIHLEFYSFINGVMYNPNQWLKTCQWVFLNLSHPT